MLEIPFGVASSGLVSEEAFWLLNPCRGLCREMLFGTRLGRRYWRRGMLLIRTDPLDAGTLHKSISSIL
jgi:hypothetical protein